MKKENKDTALKYLNQGAGSFLDAALMALFGLGVICFFAYSKFLAIPLIVIPVVLVIFIRGSKIKDAEYERELDLVLRDGDIQRKASNILAEYDVSVQPVRIGTDKIARSPVFSIAKFDFSDDSCLLTHTVVNIVEKTCESKEYKIEKDAKCEIVQKQHQLKSGKIKADYLTINSYPELLMPIPRLSYDAENIVKKINGR
jgi:hypothetical protein